MNSASLDRFVIKKATEAIMSSITSIGLAFVGMHFALNGANDIGMLFSYGAYQMVAASVIFFLLSGFYRRSVVVPLMQIADFTENDISENAFMWVKASRKMLGSAKYVPYWIFVMVIVISGLVSPNLIIGAFSISLDINKPIAAALSIASLAVITMKSLREMNESH
jgi:hypothetical protein